MVRQSLGVVAAALAVASCSVRPQPAEVGEVSVPESPAARMFPVGAPSDYQLGGAYPPPAGVTMVVRDSTARPEAGMYNVCYVNGFQTQPADRELWLGERGDLVLRGNGGQPVVDPNWPGEMLLDTSTVEKRARLATIVGATITACATAGFDAVEIDNLDSDTRSRGALTVENNLALATQLAESAHDKGLLVGQKNAAGLAERGKADVGFDFAVAEECVAYAECAEYTAVYGQRVLAVEYTDNLPARGVCDDPNRPRATIIRDRDLVKPGERGYSYQRC
ncbi:endo alpha-1,4 polygalactosaminidase [Umezawaea endophytica]|uniref:Endo alpha-1,4 polygalactosaminidase n=1 Tax=Umezawaea endophytica TaxID=1654476 RepID=A0A9X3AG27_9PSEU|nr:endo alpha-1,4 polygalactosaminidase [Umezawaea endophytica]MCS7479552.1 endo alpha-1,4 polygalactosaminidase [Umezawaea endophytica]